MSIYVSKNNQRLGPFEESAIGDFLRSGAFSPNDLAWRDGMNSWQPLHTLLPNAAPPQAWTTAGSPLPNKSQSNVGSPAFWGLLIIGAIGFLVGGFVGFSLRPAAPFIGQLPFDVVITRGANLTGLDTLLVGIAQTSFNYMMTGTVLGAVLGALTGIFVGPFLASSRR